MKVWSVGIAFGITALVASAGLAEVLKSEGITDRIGQYEPTKPLPSVARLVDPVGPRSAGILDKNPWLKPSRPLSETEILAQRVQDLEEELRWLALQLRQAAQSRQQLEAQVQRLQLENSVLFSRLLALESDLKRLKAEQEKMKAEVAAQHTKVTFGWDPELYQRLGIVPEKFNYGSIDFLDPGKEEPASTTSKPTPNPLAPKSQALVLMEELFRDPEILKARLLKRVGTK